MHEASLYENNVFVTLTYDDQHCPPELVPVDLQLWLKRLRKLASNGSAVVTSGSGIRFFACGEYGGITGRPHYHAVLFNCGFRDSVRVGSALFHSATLARLWPYGEHKIGTVTAQSAGYVAKYNCKSGIREHCDEFGVVLRKPFLRMSRRPGIGASWLERFSEDLRSGFLVADGSRQRIPRAYLRRIERENPQYADEIRHRAYQRRMDVGPVSQERNEAGAVIAKSRARQRNL